jgi:hypothetical protein
MRTNSFSNSQKTKNYKLPRKLLAEKPKKKSSASPIGGRSKRSPKIQNATPSQLTYHGKT